MTSLDEPTFPPPEGEPLPEGDRGQPDQPLATSPTADTVAQRRPAEPDAVCAGAVALARSAAEELAGQGEVGDHLGVLAEGERLVTHYFACRARGYQGWRWAITVARAPRSRSATVCETVLLPGDGAVLAPAWVPWTDRLAPGDLGTVDVLPYREDDPLLLPGYTQTGDEEADHLAVWEFGLGRVRVLGPLGRDETTARWYHGDRGPTADEAVHAAAACSTCGYFLPLAGTLRQVFGVCANEWSPSDGRVVSVDHGCGAHSETDVERPEPIPLPEPILDETGAEAVVLPQRAPVVTADDVPAEVAEPPVPEPVGQPVPEPVDQPVPEPVQTQAIGGSGGEGAGAVIEVPVGQPVPEPVDQPVPEPVQTQAIGGSGGEGAGAVIEVPVLVGDGIVPVPVMPLRLTPPIDVGPVAEPPVGPVAEPPEEPDRPLREPEP
jgi:hypothetical protein